MTAKWCMNLISRQRTLYKCTGAQMMRSENIHEEELAANTLVTLIKACSTLKELEMGKAIHLGVLQSNNDPNLYVMNSLVSLYAKCGDMSEASCVFENMPVRDTVSWNILIKGYVTNGKSQLALNIFSRMDMEPDDLTLVAALTACASLKTLENGMAIHACARSSGYESTIFVASTLIDMYTKCGSMLDARKVFDTMSQHDIVSWNALILGYVENRESELAFELTVFAKMQLQPDSRFYVAALVACSDLAESEQVKYESLEKGRALHTEARKHGFDTDMFVASTLIDMYARCRSMSDARAVFDRIRQPDIVLWNALILGYAENGEAKLALELFEEMSRRGDYVPNARSFISALVACGELASEEEGKLLKSKSFEKVLALHAQARKHSQDVSHVFLGNALIDAYSKCGSMCDARRVFDCMEQQDIVSWTTLILGYAENREDRLALQLFSKLETHGACIPNARTYVAALIASTNLSDLETGKALHKEAREHGFDTDRYVANSLVDLYGKCGCMDAAKEVFDAMPDKSLVAWSALMSGYSCQGLSERVFESFDRMCDSGIQPDRVTFLSLLAACSHAGLVEKGKMFFEEMNCKYGVKPDVDHYNAVIDMLGRANRITEAVKMAKEMPYTDSVVTWVTILGACQKWKNVVMGKYAFDSATRLDTSLHVAYVLMANIYASVGMHFEQAEVLALQMFLFI